MKSPLQADLFEDQRFPVRIASERIDVEAFRARVALAMAKAVRQCPHDRAVIAARMAQYLNTGSISRATLDAYTAQSKPHEPSLSRFKAFVHATGATWLWDEILRDDGLTLLHGEEALLAQAGELQREREEINKRIKAVKSELFRARGHR